MLKPPEPAEEPQAERPVGELVHQLVEQGKAYAEAELALAKAMAIAKVKALAWPAGIFFVALLASQATITVLAVAAFYALSLAMNPLLAGLLASLIFAAITASLVWYALHRLRQIL
jgi:hypothetical protein